MHFIIIRFSSIGDIVLTTPVVRCIKKQMPNATIHYVTKQSNKALLQANIYIDKIHTLQNDDFSALVETVKNEIAGIPKKEVAIIDLHNNFRSARLKQALIGVKAYTFNKLSLRKIIYNTLHINLLPNVHVVDRYMATLKKFNISNDGAGLDYFIPKLDEVKTDDIPMALSAGYVGIVVGASYFTKRMPTQQLVQLVQQLQYPIMLLGGANDRAAAAEVAKVDPMRIYNACGKFNINESADLVRRAKIIISNDTGLMHIAAAFKKKIISLWGATVPAFGVAPYQTQHANFILNLRCQPCSKYGTNTCPKGHFKCMSNLNTAQIAATAMDWLK
jgi:ADP-heptose:LPS heptosyltransferase